MKIYITPKLLLAYRVSDFKRTKMLVVGIGFVVVSIAIMMFRNFDNHYSVVELVIRSVIYGLLAFIGLHIADLLRTVLMYFLYWRGFGFDVFYDQNGITIVDSGATLNIPDHIIREKIFVLGYCIMLTDAGRYAVPTVLLKEFLEGKEDGLSKRYRATLLN